MPYGVLGILNMKQDINLYFYRCGYVNDWRVMDEVNVSDFGGCEQLVNIGQISTFIK